MHDGAGSERSILITGCSSGIGLDAAIALKARGWRVFATCRQEEDCERLKRDGFESFRLDYEDENSIASALDQALEGTGGTLDALFNNGAYAIPGAVEDLPRDALRAIFEVNLFGYHDLARRVIPVMRAQGHGRIVNCSSILGFVVMPWRGAYNATKYALEGLTDTMRIELRPAGIHVSLIEPGPIHSLFRQNSRVHFEKWIDRENSAVANLYRKALEPRLYDDNPKKDRFELPARAVSDKLVHAVEASRPRPRYYVTTPTYLLGIVKRFTSTRLLDRIIASSGY